jgi:glycosyltransferase involved in cell wall biosynthesis
LTTTLAADSLVSIVIPCFARATADVELLDETLRSVAQQSCQNYEVIVVDDGSPLDIAHVVDRHPRTSIVRRANGGSALARNSGIAASRGRFLVFLDADDHLLPCALETGLQHLAQHMDCGWTVGPREEMTYGGVPVPWGIAQPLPGDDIYLPLLRFDWYIIPPSAAMFRRSLVDSIGGFQDPWGADDLDFYLRAARASRACCFQSPAVTRYRRYSESSSRDGERMLTSIRIVYERQRAVIAGNPAAEAAFVQGLARLTAIFQDCLAENIVDRVRARRWGAAFRAAALLARENPARFVLAMRGAAGAFLRGARAA